MLWEGVMPMLQSYTNNRDKIVKAFLILDWLRRYIAVYALHRNEMHCCLQQEMKNMFVNIFSLPFSRILRQSHLHQSIAPLHKCIFVESPFPESTSAWRKRIRSESNEDDLLKWHLPEALRFIDWGLVLPRYNRRIRQRQMKDGQVRGWQSR